jgi:hypothetical protein
MRRIALGCLLVLISVPAASAADRTDRIPASVGPDDYRSYFVNPSTPAGVDSALWQAAAKRTLERWGATYLGTTTVSPDVHTDGINVIGFSAIAEAGVLGRNTKGKGGVRKNPGGGDTCAPIATTVVNETLTPVAETIKLKLRSDRIVRRKVRKRTVTTTRKVNTARIDTSPVIGQRCVTTTPDFESDPATVKHESDVQMDTAPPKPWYIGPSYPTGDQVDLETVLLHELGHAAGLDHQLQQCDPSTPMYPSTSNGDFWRGVDETHIQACGGIYGVTPDPAAGAEGPFGFASLGGMPFVVNPAVPPGYDSARFVALAQSIVERWGGTFAGTTALKPTQGDGQNVIGFDVIAGVDYEISSFGSRERLVTPARADCTLTTGPVSTYKVKRVTKRRRIRVRGRRKTLKYRKDRVVTTKVQGPVSGTCATVAAVTDQKAPAREVDLGLANEMNAYEMGPKHPVQRTRVDMATMLADAVGRIAGAPVTDPCARTSPVADDLLPGEWWRSPNDVQRFDCGAPRAAVRSAGRAGREWHVLVRE